MGTYDQVYFPFADGVWSYNCASCGSKCCKGHGFSATQPEFVKLTRRHPRLALFANAVDRHGVVALNNLADQCFFLQDDGYCRVQAEEGYDAKPFVCRTFPLNIYRISESAGTLFVSPNALCPIKRFEGEQGDYQIRHADLLKEVHQAKDAIRATAKGLHSSEADVPAPKFERVWASTDIEFETWCRDLTLASTELLSPVAYHASALSYWDSTQTLPPANFGGGDEAQACQDHMLAVIARSAAALGIPPVDSAAVLRNPHMLSLVPMLRVWLVENLTSLHVSDVLSMVPGTFANLALFAHEASYLSQRTISLTECMSIQRRYSGAATLLSYLDDKPWLEAIPDTPPAAIPKGVNRTTIEIATGMLANKQLSLRDWLTQCNSLSQPDMIATLDGLWKMRSWLRFA